MLITPEYCRVMAGYNAWQNDGLRRIAEAMPDAALREGRGAFFGSILKTLNHVLWADRVWLSRLTGSARPEGGIAQGLEMTPTAAVWGAERFRTDGQITVWAARLNAVDLVGDLVWRSGVTGHEERRPIGQVVMHMFNHQTHHRGQVHAMLTAAGETPGPTDLFLMPQKN